MSGFHPGLAARIAHDGRSNRSVGYRPSSSRSLPLERTPKADAPSDPLAHMVGYDTLSAGVMNEIAGSDRT